MVARWLAEPLVARWWAHDTSADAVERDLGPAVDGAEPTAMYLSRVDDAPFGLVQIYAIAAYPEYLEDLTPVCPIPPGALSIDYLIGEPEARRRGLGAALIAAAVARAFADHPGADDVIVPVAAGNTASIRALQRAGATWYADGELTPDNPVDPREHVLHRFVRER